MKWRIFRRNSESGQAAIEFALAAPFLLAFIMFTIDAGLLAFSYVSATHAVREGARCAAVGGTDAAVISRVTAAGDSAANTLAVHAPVRGSQVGDQVTVSADYSYEWVTPVGLLPGLGLSTFTFTKSATMRMETAAPYTKAVC